MADLALSNVINVSLSGLPSGLTERNVNNIALFTTASPDNVDIYRDYFSSREVAVDYGSSSIATSMAEAIFSQTPNIMSGNGVLRIIPLAGSISATSGHFTTANIFPNLAALIAVTNGDIRVTVDGTNVDITGVSFALATTIAEIGEILQQYLTNVIVTPVSTTGLKFESKTVGTTSTVLLAAVPSGTGTALAGSGYLNSAGGTSVAGTNSSGAALTAGTFTTPDISANLSGIYAVTTGDLKIAVDGVSHTYTGITFSGAATIANVATMLGAIITNVTVTNNTNELIFTSKIIGSASSVVLSAAGGAGVDLYGNSYFKGATGVEVLGTDVAGETLIEAIVRTEQLIPYVGVLTDLEMEDSVITALAASIQSRDMIYMQHFCSTADLTGEIATIKNATETHTRCLLYTVSREEANLMKAAYTGRAFSTNFSGSNTSSTMNLKPLATIDPDSGINQTIYNAAITAGADLYVSYSGVPSAVSNGANLFFDQIYSRLALKFALETGGFNYLRQTNTKVPQTEAGMIGLKNAYIIQLNRFVINGYIGQGLTWNSSETFGNPEDFRRNITENGYYVYSIPVATQIQSERESRIAPLISISVKESGAIQHSDVIVTVEA